MNECWEQVKCEKMRGTAGHTDVLFLNKVVSGSAADLWPVRRAKGATPKTLQGAVSDPCRDCAG